MSLMFVKHAAPQDMFMQVYCSVPTADAAKWGALLQSNILWQYSLPVAAAQALCQEEMCGTALQLKCNWQLPLLHVQICCRQSGVLAPHCQPQAPAAA